MGRLLSKPQLLLARPEERSRGQGRQGKRGTVDHITLAPYRATPSTHRDRQSRVCSVEDSAAAAGARAAEVAAAGGYIDYLPDQIQLANLDNVSLGSEVFMLPEQVPF